MGISARVNGERVVCHYIRKCPLRKQLSSINCSLQQPTSFTSLSFDPFNTLSMSAPQTFLSLDHIRPTAREVFRGLLRAIENEPRPLLSLIYAMPRPERLGDQRTPRPPNTFLLFKSWISKAFGSEEAGIAEELWWELKLANSSIIACFTSMQLEAKEKHLQVFPDYKYLRRKKKKDTNGNQDGDGEASSCGMRADASYNGQVQPNADLYYTHNAVYQTTSSSSSVSASYASSGKAFRLKIPFYCHINTDAEI